MPLLGLAPDGGYLAAPVTQRAGGLLHHLFTLTGVTPGGLFLWPNPAGTGRKTGPTPGVTRHCALWSADFPLDDRLAPAPSGCPASLAKA